MQRCSTGLAPLSPQNDHEILSSDFFRASDGIFRSYVGCFTLKSRFLDEKQRKTFSEQAMESRTFSEEVMEFSERESGSFEEFVLIPFRGSDGNPTDWDFLQRSIA